MKTVFSFTIFLVAIFVSSGLCVTRDWRGREIIYKSQYRPRTVIKPATNCDGELNSTPSFDQDIKYDNYL